MQIRISKTFKIIGLLMFMVILFMGGCKLLVREIFNSKDCERFNIDNIEVRTGVNIPKVSDCNCVVDGNTKTSSFIIDVNQVDVNEYSRKHHFEKADSLFALSNITDHTKWNATLNMETAELRFTLYYLK